MAARVIEGRKSDFVKARIEPYNKIRWQMAAEKLGTNVSGLIRIAVETYIEALGGGSSDRG